MISEYHLTVKTGVMALIHIIIVKRETRTFVFDLFFFKAYTTFKNKKTYGWLDNLIGCIVGWLVFRFL